jgi:hypothetical protein
MEFDKNRSKEEPEKELPQEVYVTRFIYQKLIGYQCDGTGNFKNKVYEAKVSLSDGSTKILYGIKTYSSSDNVDWLEYIDKPKPLIHRDSLGIWVVDPKSITDTSKSV